MSVCISIDNYIYIRIYIHSYKIVITIKAKLHSRTIWVKIDVISLHRLDTSQVKGQEALNLHWPCGGHWHPWRFPGKTWLEWNVSCKGSPVPSLVPSYNIPDSFSNESNHVWKKEMRKTMYYYCYYCYLFYQGVSAGQEVRGIVIPSTERLCIVSNALVLYSIKCNYIASHASVLYCIKMQMYCIVHEQNNNEMLLYCVQNSQIFPSHALDIATAWQRHGKHGMDTAKTRQRHGRDTWQRHMSKASQRHG